ncbi:MAG: hypothetical protein L0Z50_16625, partial [Verrucomicrobiales bacterium]|nr:hypothetical protein [Verrucomicrobiales bacterium]
TIRMNSMLHPSVSDSAPRATTPTEIKSWVRESMRLDPKSLIVVNEGEDEECGISSCRTRIIVAVASRVFQTFSVPRPLRRVTRMDVLGAITSPENPNSPACP